LAENPDLTVREYLAQRRKVSEHQLAARTVRSYVERLERHVLPKLGHAQVRAIRPRHVKHLLADKQQQGHSPNSVRLIKAALSALQEVRS
jgi:site-specific recombinase XerC